MAKTLRIALVGPFPPPYGGMSSYFDRLGTVIAAQGHESVLVNVPHIGQSGPWRYIKRLALFTRASLRVLFARVDVVHCITGSSYNLLANVLPMAAARLSSTPLVLSIVGADVPQVTDAGTRPRKKLLKTLLSWPDLTIACNAENKRALEQLGIPKERVEVLSNALPLPTNLDLDGSSFGVPDRFLDFCERHEPLLFSISACYYVYGTMELLEAVAGLRRLYPKMGLILVVKQGEDAKFVAEFEKFVEEYDLAKSLLTLRDVPDILALMRHAEVFVRTPHTDGDSISVREALSAGIPVVASDAGYRPESVTLFRPGDSKDLQEQLEEVLAGPHPDQQCPENLGQEGHLNLRRLLAAYESLASSKS